MSWGQGSTKAWRRTRQIVLNRDGYMCQLQYPGCTSEATEVDHIYNLASTGEQRRDAVDPEDCRAVCHSCHQRKTSHEAHAGRRSTKPGYTPHPAYK